MSLQGVRAKRGYSYEKLEREGTRLRQLLSPTTPLTEPFPMEHVWERLDRYFIELPDQSKAFLDPHVFENELPHEGMSFYSIRDRRFVVALSERTYRDMKSGVPRARYTAAHEMLHVALHSILLMERATMSREELVGLNRQVPNHKPFMDTEWQANAGAAAMLCPALGMSQLEQQTDHELSEAELCHTFRLSLQSASIRIKLFRERGRALVVAGSQALSRQ